MLIFAEWRLAVRMWDRDDGEAGPNVVEALEVRRLAVVRPWQMEVRGVDEHDSSPESCLCMTAALVMWAGAAAVMRPSEALVLGLAEVAESVTDRQCRSFLPRSLFQTRPSPSGPMMWSQTCCRRLGGMNRSQGKPHTPSIYRFLPEWHVKRETARPLERLGWEKWLASPWRLLPSYAESAAKTWMALDKPPNSRAGGGNTVSVNHDKNFHDAGI